MTSLAEVLAAHAGWDVAPYGGVTCRCWLRAKADRAADVALSVNFETVNGWAAHIVEAIAAAGLAVVELPSLDDVADDYVLDGQNIKHFSHNGYGSYRLIGLNHARYIAGAMLALVAAAAEAEGSGHE